MKHLAIAVSMVMPLAAADPAGFAQWTGKQLKAYEKTLAPKMNDQKIALEQLANYGSHSAMVAHREASGEAELHETQADVFFVQSGKATLIVGGTVENGRTTAPNEVRGKGIQGGEKKELGPGDVVHIPAKTPHQLLVDKGKQFTYLIVKIDSK